MSAVEEYLSTRDLWSVTMPEETAEGTLYRPNIPVVRKSLADAAIAELEARSDKDFADWEEAAAKAEELLNRVIAELEAEVVKYKDDALVQYKARKLAEAELAALKAAAARAAAFVLPTGYDEDLALKMMTNAEPYGFAFVADREYKRAEQAEADSTRLFDEAQRCRARIAELEAKLALSIAQTDYANGALKTALDRDFEARAELAGTQAALNAMTKGNMEACTELAAQRAINQPLMEQNELLKAELAALREAIARCHIYRLPVIAAHAGTGVVGVHWVDGIDNSEVVSVLFGGDAPPVYESVSGDPWAELAAVEGRRCETCEASQRPHPCWIFAAYRSGLGDPPSKRPFSCSRWAEREETP